jgi:hypothetical protein
MNTPSQTSADAAASIAPHLQRLEAVVIDTVRTLGSATSDDVERIAGLSHQTTSARFTALSRRGILIPSGETRKTRSGRKACAWRVAL